MIILKRLWKEKAEEVFSHIDFMVRAETTENLQAAKYLKKGDWLASHPSEASKGYSTPAGPGLNLGLAEATAQS